MSRGIELFIRMHLVKTTVNDEPRGRQFIPGDVILCLLGKLQRENPIGSDAIMWRWLDDLPAMERLEKALVSLIPDNAKRRGLCEHIISLAIAVYADKPLASQSRKLTALWRQYGEQATRSKRRIKRLHVDIRQLEKNRMLSSSTAICRIEDDISRKQGLIDDERARLDAYAVKQAQKTNLCPRCGGTGSHKVGETCPSCHGGVLIATPDTVRLHLRHTNIGRVSDAIWERELKPLFERVLTELHAAQGEAALTLNQWLEKEAAA
ncbi:TIGR02642 family protein [Grimontia marina]|uniref:Uncharacterized protein n=1 Tax=Grimontia marina TaxID=646534 RepID=A0A128F0B5_9GAMM|nr:TIGR02642 family protein [Grimontia marina]CZF79686.1 hypothetical protein GMA8713_01085 [Grimontia marina]